MTLPIIILHTPMVVEHVRSPLQGLETFLVCFFILHEGAEVKDISASVMFLASNTTGIELANKNL